MERWPKEKRMTRKEFLEMSARHAADVKRLRFENTKRIFLAGLVGLGFFCIIAVAVTILVI